MTPESLAALLIAPWQIVAVIFNLILLVPVVLSIICLMVYQLNLIAENITTIEEYEKVVLTKRAKKNGEVLTHTPLPSLPSLSPSLTFSSEI